MKTNKKQQTWLSSILTQLKLQLTKDFPRSNISQIRVWIGHAACVQPSLMASKQFFASPSTTILLVFSDFASCNTQRIAAASACTGSQISLTLISVLISFLNFQFEQVFENYICDKSNILLIFSIKAK